MSMFRLNEVMNELGRTTPRAYNTKHGGLGQSAGTPGFQVEFKRAHGEPISARGPAPNAGPWPIASPDEPKHSGRPMPRRPTAPTSANGRGRARKGKQCGSGGLGIRTERPLGTGSGPSGAGQSAAAARGPPNVGPRPRPAPRCCLCAGGRGSRTATLARRAAGRRRSGAAGGGRASRGRPASRGRRARARRRSHVGEHGRAAAPGHDQPVRAGGGLRGRPGEAAAAGGPLAVRDRPEHVFPRNQHSQRPPPPPDDVHPQQHASHAAQLPRRPGHVLQAARLRGPAEQQPHAGRGLLAPRKLQPLLGLVPAQPPGRLDAALLPDGPRLPPPAPPTAHVAPRSPAGGRPAESHGCRGRPEMRLDTPRGRSWAVRVVGTQEGRAGAGRAGFLKIALEDFIKEFGGRGDSKLPEPLGSVRSFSSGKFFCF